MEKRQSTTLGNMTAGMVGGGAFVFSILVMQLGVLPSLGLAFPAYWISDRLLSRKAGDEATGTGWQGVSRRDLEETLKEGRRKLGQIRSNIWKIEDRRVRGKVEAVAGVVEKMLEHFKKNPEDIRAARSFLNYQLDSTIKVIGNYTRLSQLPDPPPETVKSLDDAENLLGTMEQAFSRQFRKIQEHDVMDLDVEVALLKKTFKMEGLEE